jgi:hypothetical protein
MVTYVLCGVILLELVAFVGLLDGSVRRIRKLRLALAGMQQAVQGATSSVDMLAAEAKLQKRRADEFFGIIEGVEKERDQWQALYRRSSQAAGGAQAWLIRDLTNAVQRGNAYAKLLHEKGVRVDPIAVDPALSKAIEEFAGQHVASPEVPQTAALATAQKVEKALSEQSIGTG